MVINTWRFVFLTIDEVHRVMLPEDHPSHINVAHLSGTYVDADTHTEARRIAQAQRDELTSKTNIVRRFAFLDPAQVVKVEDTYLHVPFNQLETL